MINQGRERRVKDDRKRHDDVNDDDKREEEESCYRPSIITRWLDYCMIPINLNYENIWDQIQSNNYDDDDRKIIARMIIMLQDVYTDALY